jgi:hypothetical protein
MGKNKIARFAENLTFEHVVQPTFTQLVNGRSAATRPLERATLQA